MAFWRPYPSGQRAIVTTKQGRSFRGLVQGRRGTAWVLRQAELLQRADDPTRVDGEVVVFERDIDFIQVLPGNG